jgi:hypothetical protein
VYSVAGQFVGKKRQDDVKNMSRIFLKTTGFIQYHPLALPLNWKRFFISLDHPCEGSSISILSQIRKSSQGFAGRGKKFVGVESNQ